MKVVYVESHAGAGCYPIDHNRVGTISFDKKRVCAAEGNWALFDRLNNRIQDGVYIGSFILALKLLLDWKQRKASRSFELLLWEADPQVRTTIQECIAELSAPSPFGCRLKSECTVIDFNAEVASYVADGWTVIWLCDPYWGNSKDTDRQWFRTLSADAPGDSTVYGLLFAFLGGNSQHTGPNKFDYVKSLGAPTTPKFRIDNNIRSYGLYCTERASNLLQTSPAPR